MIAIAVVLLVLGFLFATLQYPAAMRRFWKWTLISAGSVVLVIVIIMTAVVMNEPKPNKPSVQNSFDQFDDKEFEQSVCKSKKPAELTDEELCKCVMMTYDAASGKCR